MRHLRLVTLLAAIAATAASAQQITLYEHDNFAGRTLSASDTVQNLANTGFNDRASSAVVRGGRWQACSDAYFRGNCVTLGPGNYTSLREMGMNDRISSVREIGWGGSAGGGAWSGGRNTRVVLYETPNFGGRTFTIDSNYVANLGNTGFNDRASSVRVERGYWIFCSDANFQGECRTLGPGDYAHLPSGLNDRISSARRISDEYPYSSAPNWRDGRG